MCGNLGQVRPCVLLKKRRDEVSVSVRCARDVPGQALLISGPATPALGLRFNRGEC